MRLDLVLYEGWVAYFSPLCVERAKVLLGRWLSCILQPLVCVEQARVSLESGGVANFHPLCVLREL